MEHKQSMSAIYYSTNYKAFKFMPGNRVLNESKIKKIINDIDSGLNMLKHCPIVVTKDLVIIDGQHRYQVSKILKIPIYYTIADGISLYDVARINSRTERWKPIDFVRCYAEIGNPNYKQLKKFIETFEGMPVSSAIFCLGVINGPEPDGRIMKKFESGEFVVQSFEGAKVLANQAELFKSEKFKSHFSVSFLKALNVVMNSGQCEMDRLIEKYEKASHILQPVGNWKMYAQQLENIYNYNNQKRIPIY